MNESFKVLRYQAGDGHQPFTEWIHHLKDRQAANLIWARVDRFEGGHFGKTRHISQKVWEMKIDFGPGYRVFYLRDENHVIVLLCGGDKNSQDREIDRALRYAADYWRRK